MHRRFLEICAAAAVTVSIAAGADASAIKKLSAAEVVDRNVAARGGLEAWRAVQTLSISGTLGAGGNQRPVIHLPSKGPTSFSARRPSTDSDKQTRPVEEARLPFRMELKRPHKMRFELDFNGQTAVQVFDGAAGWKLRPFLNRHEVEPYTADEMKMASMQADLDGPLVDYAAKGTSIELVGMDKVEDRDAYKIKVTMKNGTSVHVWIDAKTFLEAKMDGQPRRLDGVDHPVEIFLRNYRTVNGLQIPFLLETKVVPVTRTALGTKDPPVPPETILVDNAVVNAKLEDARFSKPVLQLASNAKK